MKRWIDYLFWKRTWFRMIFILFPVLAFFVTILLYWLFNVDFKSTLIITYVIFFILGIIDNDNMDGVDMPLSGVL